MHSSRGPALPLAGSGIKLFLLVASTLRQLVSAHPLASYGNRPDEPPGTPQFWWKLGVSVVLILGGGVFAGLTIALMGQDIINLQVLAESGEERERKHAAKVLSLLKRGKHWVLVTLLLCNVLTNESLPIVMDSILPGGLYAVAISTVSIVIFGEIIPQSLCVRYGLPIGAAFVPPTLGLMYLMYPVAYPIAKLLDYLLGDDEGTVYKKAGLKTLVTLHKTLGADRLNEDEVTIITAVLDLKDKSVASVMTPIEDVFTMSADTILDEPMVDTILKEGYSRIPIYQPGNPTNFVGMLLVKILITYDPEDRVPVSNFTLATLPETRPEVSCLDILNFFQEGKSHMVLVSENPGEPTGALGLLTCEDIIEELIGEEIVDESDVYIDVHQKTRRLDTAPLRKGHRINFTSLERRQTNLSNLTAGKPSAVKPLFRPANVAHNPTETKTTKVTIKPTTSANLTPQKGSDRSGVGLRDAQHSDLSASPGPGHTSEQQAMHENLNSDTEEQATDEEAEVSDERRPLLLQVPKDRHGHAKAKRTRVRSGSIIETTVEQPDGTIKMVVGCTHDHSALSDAESSESGYQTPKNGTKVPSSQHRRPASARSVGSQASSRDGPLLQIEGDSRDYRTRQAQSQRKK